MTAASLTTFRTRAQATMEALYPATIRLGESATDLACAAAGIRCGDTFGGGGFVLDDTVTFRVKKSLVATRPANGTSVLWVEKSITFAIDETRESNTDVAWVLICKKPNAR